MMILKVPNSDLHFCDLHTSTILLNKICLPDLSNTASWKTKIHRIVFC